MEAQIFRYVRNDFGQVLAQEYLSTFQIGSLAELNSYLQDRYHVSLRALRLCHRCLSCNGRLCAQKAVGGYHRMDVPDDEGTNATVEFYCLQFSERLPDSWSRDAALLKEDDECAFAVETGHRFECPLCDDTEEIVN